MRFDLVKDPQKLAKLKQKLAHKYPYTLEKFGRIVRYEMPSLPQRFPRLLRLLDNGPYPKKFWGLEYYIATKGGYIDRIIPSTEYYKYAFRAIADKYYSLTLSVKSIEQLIAEIREIYKCGRFTISRTSQPSFSIHNQVYSLKSELGNLFFTSRSIMDSVATLMHFLYGPNSSQFNSFVDFRRYICKPNQTTGGIADETMKEFVEKKMEWFARLRDIRDYITHFKSIDISFYEQADSEIDVYLEDQFEITELIGSIKEGVTGFLDFMDDHFSRRLMESA